MDIDQQHLDTSSAPVFITNEPPSPLAIAKDENASLISANSLDDNSTVSTMRGVAAADDDEDDELVDEGATFGGICGC